MQNRYVGDIGDFGKYALLRIISKTGLALGVNWYLTPDENHNFDGKHISYLHKSEYKGLDDELFFILKDIIERDKRHVFSIQESVILAGNTVFYDNVLDFAGETNPTKRKIHRKSWHDTALNKLKDCDIVFMDPDNGLQVKSSLTGKKGNKYIGVDEFKDYYKLGKSIIFYNHRERKQEEEYLGKFRKLSADHVFKDAKWLGLKFSRGTIRDYIFVLQPGHADAINIQCENLLNTGWKNHFSLLCI